MNTTSKENLLKLLINEPTEDPGENKSEYNGYEKTAVGVSAIITYDQLQYQSYTIGLNGTLGGADSGKLILYDSDGNLLLHKRPVSNGVEYNVITIDIDENGDMYGIIDASNNTYLAYFDNPFVQNVNGEYDVTIRKSYKLNSMLSEIRSQIGSNSTVYNMDIKKNPISRTVSNKLGVW